MYDDRMRIETPEGVDLELTLAGLGSRVGSAVVDAVIRGLLYVAILLLVGVSIWGGGVDPGSGFLTAILIVLIFFIEVGYDIAFETLASGRTVGKRIAGLRVLRIDGSPVDFRSSAIRNLLRLVDGALTGYLAGVISVLVTSKNQRLGDLAAGTVVVRDRVAEVKTTGVSYLYADGTEPLALDATAVSREDVATLRRFLERRSDLDPVARTRLANELSQRLRMKVSGVPEHVNPERLIEEIVRTKSGD
jgi:uncharacterized RDD family membrane protein YckC